VGRPCQI